MVVKLQEVAEDEQELDGDGRRDEVLGLGEELCVSETGGIELTFWSKPIVFST
jgi:hypothetical protein